MRFGKKLALAMIRDAGEAPYISQKELKHQLVGLEKLCKVYIEQVEQLSSPLCAIDEVLGHIREQRLNYGLQSREGILDIGEVKSKDGTFIGILERDIRRIRGYVDATLARLMLSMNELLEVLADSRIILREDELYAAHAPATLASLLTDNGHRVSGSADGEIVEIITECNRLGQYIEVNQSAIRKLIQRRCKNVPRCFWCHEFHDLEIGLSLENSRLVQTAKFLEQVMAVAPVPAHYNIDLRVET